jgi:class 3 adenylate cyclase
VTYYSAEAAGQRAGVGTAHVRRLTELGLLTSDGANYTDADVRRIQVIALLEQSGMAADAVADVVARGGFSLEFIDRSGYGVFSALSDETFAQVSARTDVPLEQLTVLRDVTGDKPAGANDLVREHEMDILQLVQYQLELGFRWPAIERALHVYRDSLRRIAEGEAEWWRSEIQSPMLEAGGSTEALGRRAAEISPRLTEASDRALLAIYHSQQMHVWSVNIVQGIATALEQAGLRERDEPVPPAMCFLDLTGFTELTQRLGDAAAADMLEKLNRIVHRIAIEHRGRPVKWLGDGVMLVFSDPPAGVAAAIQMVDALARANLPPAHVGLHVGPVVRQEGDYYGQTVNLAARIGDYARPGEVLVSRAVVDAAVGSPLSFDEVGPVSLKGVSGLVQIFVARPSSTKRRAGGRRDRG